MGQTFCLLLANKFCFFFIRVTRAQLSRERLKRKKKKGRGGGALNRHFSAKSTNGGYCPLSETKTQTQKRTPPGAQIRHARSAMSLVML